MGPVDPHHVDGKGMGGARCRDDRVVPLCRHHHDQAHAGIFTDGQAARWAHENLCDFLDLATVEEVRLYFAELKRWKERPLAVAF